ncbi:unnamed protein product, partial [Choristocarpus tenellus]
MYLFWGGGGSCLPLVHKGNASIGKLTPMTLSLSAHRSGRQFLLFKKKSAFASCFFSQSAIIFFIRTVPYLYALLPSSNRHELFLSIFYFLLLTIYTCGGLLLCSAFGS